MADRGQSWLLLLILLSSALVPVPCAAQDGLARCTKLEQADERLACYDALAGRPPKGGAAAEGPQAPPSGGPAVQHGGESYLARTWRLGAKGSSPITALMPYRPLYVLVRRTSDVNQQPHSPTHLAPAPEDWDPGEFKFQLSVKTELVSPRNFSFLGTDRLRLWFGYTQQSHWQIFNTRNSSPFRESNYEPEFILTYDRGGQNSDFKLANFGLVHQSNGQSGAHSRSWNRLYLQGGWEWGSLSLLARGWWRLPEDASRDDNPDIKDYLGRGDLVLRWQPAKDNTVSLLARHNLRLDPGRGYAQLDWATPLRWGAGGFHVQATFGYGESLIDYNHNQKTLGVGLSFGDW